MNSFMNTMMSLMGNNTSNNNNVNNSSTNILGLPRPQQQTTNITSTQQQLRNPYQRPPLNASLALPVPPPPTTFSFSEDVGSTQQQQQHHQAVRRDRED